MANVVCLPKVHVQISCLFWQQVPRGKQNNLIFPLNRALSVSAKAHAQLLILTLPRDTSAHHMEEITGTLQYI